MKKVLIVSYHKRKSNRRGGFHDILEVLESKGYEVQWVTASLRLSSLMRSSDDRVVINDIFRAIPAYLGFRGDLLLIRLYKHRILGLNRAQRLLNSDSWDFVIIESVADLFYLSFDAIKSRLIYRPSDPLVLCRDLTLDQIEKEKSIVALANEVWVDTPQRIKELKKYWPHSKMKLVVNEPLGFDVGLIQEKKLNRFVYIGVFNLCDDCLQQINDLCKRYNVYFDVYGPYQKLNLSNVLFHGTILPSDVPRILAKYPMLLIPYAENKNELGVTAKIKLALKLGIYVVAVNMNDIQNVEGLQVVPKNRLASTLTSYMVNGIISPPRFVPYSYVIAGSTTLRFECGKL